MRKKLVLILCIIKLSNIPIIKFTIPFYKLFTEHNEFEEKDIMFVDDKCSSIDKCDSILRMARYLSFYSNIDDMDTLLNYFEDEKNKYFIDDYHHIMFHHLGDEQKTIEDSRREFENVYTYLLKYVDVCDINKLSLIHI